MNEYEFSNVTIIQIVKYFKQIWPNTVWWRFLCSCSFLYRLENYLRGSLVIKLSRVAVTNLRLRLQPPTRPKIYGRGGEDLAWQYSLYFNKSYMILKSVFGFGWLLPINKTFKVILPHTQIVKKGNYTQDWH